MTRTLISVPASVCQRHRASRLPAAEFFWWCDRRQFLVRERPDVPGERVLAGVDWRFNAWGGLKGGLYKDWRDDNLVRSLAKNAPHCLPHLLLHQVPDCRARCTVQGKVQMTSTRLQDFAC